ncbi:TPA: restriction endonuclease subunit S [Acinetobacter baumannii]
MSQLPRYENYKDSGVQWLGEIPSHWKCLSIKRLTLVKRGASPRPIDNPEYFDDEGEYAWVRIADVTASDKYLLETTQRLSELGSSLSVKMQPDSIFLSIAGSVGKPIITKVKACIHDGFVYFPDWKESINFLYYIFASGQPYLGLGKLGTQLNLNTDTVGNIKIALPPSDEQEAIVDFLDKRLAQVDTLIAKQETLLEKLAEQRVALISHAVTKGLNPDVEMKESGVSTLGEVPLHWEIIKNKFIFDFSKGLTITKENLVDEGIPCVSYGEVHSKFGFEVDPNKHQLKCVPETYIESDENSLLKYGDFIFADTSEDVKGSGNFTYLNSDIPTFAGYHTIIAKMSKLNNPRFLAYILDTEEHRNQIRMLIKGVKVFSITQAILKNTFVWLPPIDEQNQIVDYLDQEVEKYQQIGQRYELTITRLKEYRSTLITQVVTGKIDVRNLKVN